jgi:hypothetical protein
MEHFEDAFMQVVGKYSFLTNFDALDATDKDKLMLVYYSRNKTQDTNDYKEIRLAYEDYVCLAKVNKIVGKISYLNH